MLRRVCVAALIALTVACSSNSANPFSTATKAPSADAVLLFASGSWSADPGQARELFALLYQRVSSTRDICGYGDGIVRSEEWKICSEPTGNPGYAATRQTGIF